MIHDDVVVGVVAILVGVKEDKVKAEPTMRHTTAQQQLTFPYDACSNWMNMHAAHHQCLASKCCQQQLMSGNLLSKFSLTEFVRRRNQGRSFTTPYHAMQT
jgi:hypothetical protein